MAIDPQAVGGLYVRWRDPVLAYLVRRVRDPEVAADLMAETFASAIRALDRGAAVESPAAWLFAIARNEMAAAARRGQVAARARTRLKLERLALDDEDIERITELGSDAGLMAALEQLPAEQRDAVRARVLDERDYPEIASAIGCSEAVVRKRVSRGLGQLRNALEARS